MEQNDPVLDHIAAEAATWFACLRDANVSSSQRAEFAAWLLRSPDHISEYMATARTWGDVGLVRDEELSAEAVIRSALTVPPPSNVVVLQTQSSAPALPVHAEPARTRRPVFAAIAAAGIVCVLIGWLAVGHWLDAGLVSTGIGEQRAFTLPDGSVVSLNTTSEVRVDLSEHERHIHLLKGEAKFIVAKNVSWPFVVTTTNARVQALGTVFNVRESGGETSVAVLEGRVSVHNTGPGRRGVSKPGSASSPAADVSSIELAAGERAAVLARGDILENSGPPIERVRGWADRQLVFRAETLATLVAEVNRYHERQIRIGDPGLAGILISGTFAANDLDSLLQYLQAYRGVRAEPAEDGGYVLWSAAP